VWRMAYRPHQAICVLCVHRLPASALTFFLDVQCDKAGGAGRDGIAAHPGGDRGTFDRSESL